VSTSKAREGTGRKEGEGVVRMRTGKEAQSKRAEIDDGVSEAKEHTQDKEEGERPRVRFARKKNRQTTRGPKNVFKWIVRGGGEALISVNRFPPTIPQMEQGPGPKSIRPGSDTQGNYCDRSLAIGPHSPCGTHAGTRAALDPPPCYNLPDR